MFNLLTSLIFNICDVINGGVVSGMQSGNNQPSNTNTNELDLNNGGWYVIAILIGIIIVLVGVMIYKTTKAHKTEILPPDTKQEDKQLLTEYHKLNDQEKQLVNDTIKTLNKPKDE